MRRRAALAALLGAVLLLGGVVFLNRPAAKLPTSGTTRVHREKTVSGSGVEGANGIESIPVVSVPTPAPIPARPSQVFTSRTPETAKTTIPPSTSPTTTPSTLAPSSPPNGSSAPSAPFSALAAPDLPNSIFGKSVVDQPVAGDSLAVVSNLTGQIAAYFGTVGVNEMPIFNVPANAPLVPVSVLSGCSNFTASTGSQIPIPTGAYTTNSEYLDDSDIIITQPSTYSIWELWRATKDSGGAWSACWGGRLNSASSSGVFPGTYGMSASGISYAATTVTESDIASGSINHAIAMQVPECTTFVFPAVRNDCLGNGEPSEGTWFRLPSSLAMPAGMSPFAQMVFKALQTYGAVVTDRAGAVMVQAETVQDWATAGKAGADPITTSWAGKPEYDVLNGIPWSDLQVIEPPS